jgi:replication-associated recombination protein RarA
MLENDNSGIWVEKYRPQTLDTYIGNQHVIDKCKIWLDQGEIPNILLFGTAGTGKCLAFNESLNIEIELSEAEVDLLKKYIQK